YVVLHRTGEDDSQRRQNVHRRAGDHDEELLPTRPQIEALARRDVRLALALDGRVRFVATQFDVAAQRHEAHAIVGRAPASAEEARAEPDRKMPDADRAEL